VEEYQLKQRQSLPLEAKIILSRQRIKEWYEYYNGQVYVAFSGGKDSTVLLHIVRQLYPDVPAVFANTGLEFPEIYDFVKSIPNVTWLKPKMSFKMVLEKYGYPVVSKRVSMGLSRYRNTMSQEQRDLRLYGGICPSSGKRQFPTIPQKYHYLADAPFKCSEQCCTVMKKAPMHLYESATHRKPFIGTMATDGFLRHMSYLEHGCNAFDTTHPASTPLGFWTEDDIWEYIHTQNIPYSTIYDLGYKRTGCIYCMFGVQFDKGQNRFQILKKTHPKLYEYCMETLELRKVLDYMHIPYE
jgi:3'-phosphoadenosine 5'-phosphosulfate sulfotransferase (PAPS reductase)/FAD synthetase